MKRQPTFKKGARIYWYTGGGVERPGVIKGTMQGKTELFYLVRATDLPRDSPFFKSNFFVPPYRIHKEKWRSKLPF